MEEEKNLAGQKITTAVQNLVETIVDTVKQDPNISAEIVDSSKLPEPQVESTITPVIQIVNTEPVHQGYYKENLPFLVELKFTNWTKEIEDKIMNTFMHDEDLLPGLKIHKLYKASMHSDSLYLDKISENLDNIKGLVDGYRSELDKVMRNLNRQ